MADANKDSDTRRHVARKQYERFSRALERHRKYVEEAKRFSAFYAGEQWAERDLKALQEAGRPALTINHILPTVNSVLGEQAANRADIRFKPRRDGDDQVARVLHKLVHSIMDDNMFEWVESQVFADGVVEDRGFYDIRMDYETNINGDVAVVSLDPTTVIPDPDGTEYDPATWKDVFIYSWKSLDDIEQDYGKEARLNVQNSGVHRDHGESVDAFIYHAPSTFGTEEPANPVQETDDGRSVRAVRLVERQHRVRREVLVYITRYGDIREAPPSWSEERIMTFAAQNGLKVQKRMRSTIQWTVTAGDSVVLYDAPSPYRHFTVVPFFPYFRRGRPIGVVRNLISPQERLNKLESQELHIVNTTANSGWVYEIGSLQRGMTDADLAKKGSMTGFVLGYNPGTTPPQKIQPNQVPTGIDRLSLKSSEAIRSISGVHQAMQGNASPEMSGRAAASQVARSQVQLQGCIDNLAKSRHFVGQVILSMVQSFYTTERTVYITNDADPTQEDEQVTINQQAAEGVINNVTVGEYALVVSQQPSRDTYRESQFSQAMEMRQVGIPIPNYIMVRNSMLDDRLELSEAFKQREGYSEPTEQEVQMAEFQQQAQMQDIQLSIATKEAQLNKLSAETENIQAKTASEIDPQAFQNLLKIAQLTQDINKEKMNLEARMAMSSMSNESQMERAKLNAGVQSRGQDVQQETHLTTAALQSVMTANNSQTPGDE